jgi:hypothetical protein
VSTGFGILKFRLYDIDRIISRTVAYAVITGALPGTYVAPGAAGHYGGPGPAAETSGRAFRCRGPGETRA